MIAVQNSCIHASEVAVFVEWWIVVFVDNVSFHRGICTLGASFPSLLFTNMLLPHDTGLSAKPVDEDYCVNIKIL